MTSDIQKSKNQKIRIFRLETWNKGLGGVSEFGYRHRVNFHSLIKKKHGEMYADEEKVIIIMFSCVGVAVAVMFVSG